MPTWFVGHGGSHGVPVAGRVVRPDVLEYARRRVLQSPRGRARALQPRMRGVEFGDRGVHVFDVEPHLQRESAFFVDAVKLEKFVLRRPRAYVCAAYLSAEREPDARLAQR